MRVVCHAPETAKAVDFALRHVRFTPESGHFPVRTAMRAAAFEL
jgi:hypothetical protein